MARASSAGVIDSLNILARSRWDLLSATVDTFRKLEERVYGDTVRYRVLEVFSRSRSPLTCTMVARELHLGKSTAWEQTKRGRRYVGCVRREIEKLLEKRILAVDGSGVRLFYRLDRNFDFAKYLALTHGPEVTSISLRRLP